MWSHSNAALQAGSRAVCQERGKLEARSSTGLNGAIVPAADPAAAARALGEYLSPGRYVTAGVGLRARPRVQGGGCLPTIQPGGPHEMVM
jgi:hypothetical protein